MNVGDKYLEKWIGEYRNVTYHIVKSFTDFPYVKDQWFYYLIINLEKIPDEQKRSSLWLEPVFVENFTFYPYLENPILNCCEFHGGPTFYEKISEFDGGRKTIKVGCDYCHSFDEGESYSLEHIKADTNNSIDKFLFEIPDYGE